MKICDVSKWNGKIDFEGLKAEGYDGVIIRAGDGITLDPMFEENRRRARLAGLFVGYYWFFRPNMDWRVQADKFIAVCNGDYGDFPLAIDLEVTGSVLPKTRILIMAQRWLQYVEAETGRRPMIYTSPGFWKGIGGEGPSGAWAKEYDLWMAQWPFDLNPDIDRIMPNLIESVLTGEMNPVRLAPWSTAELWQFTAKGKSKHNGSNHLDIDASIRSIEGVLQYYGLGDTTRDPHMPPADSEEVSMRLYKIEKFLAEKFGYIV